MNTAEGSFKSFDKLRDHRRSPEVVVQRPELRETQVYRCNAVHTYARKGVVSSLSNRAFGAGGRVCRCNAVHTYARESVERVLSNRVLGAGGTGVSM